jgi:hypothetical protein
MQPMVIAGFWLRQPFAATGLRQILKRLRAIFVSQEGVRSIASYRRPMIWVDCKELPVVSCHNLSVIFYLSHLTILFILPPSSFIGLIAFLSNFVCSYNMRLSKFCLESEKLKHLVANLIESARPMGPWGRLVCIAFESCFYYLITPKCFSFTYYLVVTICLLRPEKIQPISSLLR